MRSDEDDLAYLQDMLDAGAAVLRHVAGKTREEYDKNEMLRDAVERRVEVFGEAARRISQASRDAHPEVPWHKIMATRHILAHDYGEVDADIMWRIATQHIPEALAFIRKLVPAAPPESA
jgi:uncharacterized protein with HEPN domain